MNRQTLFSGLLMAAATFIYTQVNTVPAVHETLLHWNQQLLSFLTTYGLLGAFLNSFISNASLAIPIPYSPLFIFLAGQAKSTTFLLALIAVGAIGSTLGEIVSFYVGRGVSLALFKESRTAAFIKQAVEKRPRLTTLYIFLAAATPFPDDFVVIPLGLMNYPVKRMILPILAGKATFLGVMVYLSHYAYLTASNYVSLGGIDPSILLLLLTLYLIFMVYQAKGRAAAVK
jgi:membrane protein YqaA with SNARE-associated domain